MTLQYSVNTRNARLDAIETYAGTSVLLSLWTGAVPANCSVANSGSQLSLLTLPSDWLAAASGGAKAKSGTWTNTSAGATGTAGYFRIHNSAGTECIMQGTVTVSGGGGDMIIDNTSIATGQTVTVTSFTITDGNA